MKEKEKKFVFYIGDGPNLLAAFTLQEPKAKEFALALGLPWPAQSAKIILGGLEVDYYASGLRRNYPMVL